MTKNDTSRNLVAALSYLLGFVTGVVILMTEKDDKFIRFHAWQSTLATGGLFILSILVGIVLSPLKILTVILDLLNILFWILIAGVIFVSFVRAYRGQMFKWPIFGKWAQKYVR